MHGWAPGERIRVTAGVWGARCAPGQFCVFIFPHLLVLRAVCRLTRSFHVSNRYTTLRKRSAYGQAKSDQQMFEEHNRCVWAVPRPTQSIIKKTMARRWSTEWSGSVVGCSSSCFCRACAKPRQISADRISSLSVIYGVFGF
jgi:hypothetical protein